MWLAIACALAVSAPDTSTHYFKGLKRPKIAQLDAKAGNGPVIVIVVDAMRPDRTSPYGAARDPSPVMSKLADEGVTLTNYFVNANWTRPSTASILTGLLPSDHQVQGEADKLKDRMTTIAELLRDAGVPTGAVIGNGNAASAFGLAQGFSEFADTVKHWKGLPTADDVVDLALPFVERHANERFFLFVFMVDPHDPYHAPGNFETQYVTDPSVPLIRTPHWEIGNYSPQQVARMQETYDGAVAYTDRALGRFFARLQELGVYDRSTIMLTADHGEAFGEHGVFLHAHHLYDEIVRAPLIIKTPAMSRRGGYSPVMAQSIDLFPTIARAFGVAPPAGLLGADLFGLLARPESSRPVIAEFTNFGIKRRMVRTLTDKVVWQLPADEAQFLATVRKKSLLPSVTFDHETIKLFDMAKDPLEQHDLYSEQAMREPRWAKLMESLRAYEKRHGAKATEVVERLDTETYRDLKELGYID